MKKRIRILFAVIPVMILMGFIFLYVNSYYHADLTALESLSSDENVIVRTIGNDWLFDGPGDDTALIFYPGAKVEETAYAPMLHLLANEGIDVFLVKMPFRMAVFGIQKAGAIQREYSYDRWYVGGHSMGGAMAAWYAADSGEGLDGMILCAAYATKTLVGGLDVLTIYGSEDRILNRDRYEKSKQFLPVHTVEHEIAGGNHAQFGNYGIQTGDGTASISTEVQQDETVDFIISVICPETNSPSLDSLDSPETIYDSEENVIGKSASVPVWTSPDVMEDLNPLNWWGKRA